MKRIYFLLLMALSLISINANAAFEPEDRGGRGPHREVSQADREKMRKEMDQFKANFIAAEIGLDGSAKSRFMEVYQQMQEEKFKVFQEAWGLQRRVKRNKNASEADYAAASRAMNEARDKDAEIDRRYEEKFASFLNSKQIFKMKTAEEAFRRKMEEMRNNRERR